MFCAVRAAPDILPKAVKYRHVQTEASSRTLVLPSPVGELAFLLHFWFYSHLAALKRSTTLSFETERERLPPLMDAKKGKTRKESTPIKVTNWEEFHGIADAHGVRLEFS